MVRLDNEVDVSIGVAAGCDRRVSLESTAVQCHRIISGPRAG